ncbi:anthocyanin regulatory Lc protein-like [Musa acuminata AAA Group]|uniref:anthocyanin regulatory Lc protein-like n=1 Tax=Musa acuminata AAA Group TaxID=214697 RepID=UPI0031D36EF9
MTADLEILEEMLARHIRKQLAAIVTKIQWSYAFFWSTSTTQPGVLEWCGGFYNGQIKTRKMIQPIELEADQMSLQRSEQLRELYESLTSGDSNQQMRRACDALYPEDLTDAEWYYLTCMSFVFNIGQGLPGKAFADNQHIWLNGAQFANCKMFSRSLLAKTVVCIPIMDGVLELGTNDLILEDPAIIEKITSSLWELPNPICSEQSISGRRMPENDEDHLCPNLDNNIDDCIGLEDQNLIADPQTQLGNGPTHIPFHLYAPIEQTEPVRCRDEELHTSIREELIVGPSDGSLNDGCPTQKVEDAFGVDGLNDISQTQSRQFMDDEFSNVLHGYLDCDVHEPLSFVNARRVVSGTEGGRKDNQILDGVQQRSLSRIVPLDLDGDDSHSAKTVAVILQNSKHVKPVSSCPKISHKSSFAIWRIDMNPPKPFTSMSQKLLKKLLVDKTWLHDGRLQSHQENGMQEKTCKPEGESGVRHVLSERRRREKLKEKFLVLRSLIPSISKVDKASVLGNTIDYLKDLERRVLELESCQEPAELEIAESRKHPDVAERSSENYRNKEIVNGEKSLAKKRKVCDVDRSNAEHLWILTKDGPIEVNVTMKDKEVLVEIHCPWRESLVFEIVESISNLQLDLLSVQSSTVDGMLSLAIKSKFRSTSVASPGMIKQSLQRVMGLL